MNRLTMSRNVEQTFITSGFDNWKDSSRMFEQHRKSACHREAAMKWAHYLDGTDVHIYLHEELSSEQEKARTCLGKIFFFH